MTLPCSIIARKILDLRENSAK